MGFKYLEFLKVGSMVLLDAKVESELKPYFLLKQVKRILLR